MALASVAHPELTTIIDNHIEAEGLSIMGDCPKIVYTKRALLLIGIECTKTLNANPPENIAAYIRYIFKTIDDTVLYKPRILIDLTLTISSTIIE